MVVLLSSSENFGIPPVRSYSYQEMCQPRRSAFHEKGAGKLKRITMAAGCTPSKRPAVVVKPRKLAGPPMDRGFCITGNRPAAQDYSAGASELLFANLPNRKKTIAADSPGIPPGPWYVSCICIPEARFACIIEMLTGQGPIRRGP
jgi:hypothetical protein